MTDSSKQGAGGGGPSRLAATLDGTPLGDDEARALWEAFSAHMDEHRGDMQGFASARNYFSVMPEYQHGRAILVVRTTEPPPAPPAKPKKKKRR